MKRFFCTFAAATLLASAAVQAAAPALSRPDGQPANDSDDSLRMHHLQQIEVVATRATAQTPVAFADLGRETIARNCYGTDLPSVLALTPSMIATNVYKKYSTPTN